jgi:hypothetical protein
MARAGFLIQFEFLDHRSKLRFMRRNRCGQLVTMRPPLFLSPRDASGAPGYFELLADQVFGQWLILSRKTGIDVLGDLLHRRRRLLRFPIQALQDRVEVCEPALLRGNVLFHIAYRLFDHLLGLFETVEDAVQISFE